MRVIHLPLFVVTDNPNDKQVQVGNMLRWAVVRDESLTKGLDRLILGKRLIEKIEGFEKSAVLELEEQEHKELCRIIDNHQWGGVGFFLVDVLTKIRDTKEGDEKPKEKKK